MKTRIVIKRAVLKQIRTALIVIGIPSVSLGLGIQLNGEYWNTNTAHATTATKQEAFDKLYELEKSFLPIRSLVNDTFVKPGLIFLAIAGLISLRLKYWPRGARKEFEPSGKADPYMFDPLRKEVNDLDWSPIGFQISSFGSQ